MSDNVEYYSVLFINYEDDYKHRYDSGVYPESPVLFKRREDVDKYINKTIYKKINDLIGELDKNDILVDYFNYNIKFFHKYLARYYYGNTHCKDLCQNNPKCTNYYYRIKKNTLNNSNEMQKLYEFFAKGYYVRYKFDYKIDLVKVN